MIAGALGGMLFFAERSRMNRNMLKVTRINLLRRISAQLIIKMSLNVVDIFFVEML